MIVKHFRSLIAVSWIVECLIQGDRIGDIIKLGTVIYICASDRLGAQSWSSDLSSSALSSPVMAPASLSRIPA